MFLWQHLMGQLNKTSDFLHWILTLGMGHCRSPEKLTQFPIIRGGGWKGARKCNPVSHNKWGPEGGQESVTQFPKGEVIL